MIIPQRDDLHEEDPPIPVEVLNSLIGRQVVRSLGSPADVLNVKVHPMGNGRYRVNVLVGKNLASARIGNSFFLTADEKGNILASTPKIVRQA